MNAVLLLVPAIAAWLLVAMLQRSRWARRLEDHPNERSLHVAPTPRVGGLGLMLAALPFAAFHADQPTAIVLGCAAALCLLSARDDVRSLPVEVRLPAHAAAAAGTVLALAAGLSWSWWQALLAVVAITWMTNLYNFMDGADGLAAGMAIVGFGAFAFAAANAHAMPLAWACGAFAAAACGFLAHNFPPARVFMGDAGSIPLGFLAGALGLLGIAAGAWDGWFPLLVFSPFIVDATVTLLRRVARGEKFWRAHREHYYQRAALAGVPRRRLALAGYALMMAAAASALVAQGQDARVRWAIISGWLAAYVLLIALCARRYPQPGREAARDAPVGRSER
jgi:UDP-N-acetylmuramyl pentapeptide phosphotransferase/UDP-N-acetylglucosamine-1-phosphate transferase